MTALNENVSNLYLKIKNGLSHFAVTPILLLYGAICFFLGLTEFLIFSYLVVFILSLFICDDLKNIFSMVLYVSYFIEDINLNAPINMYIVVIVIAVIALISFFVKNIISKKVVLKKGELFFASIFAIIAFSIGGIQRFNIKYFITTLGLFIATYVLYFIALNHTKDFKKYLPKLLLCGSIILTVQLLIQNANLGFFSDTNQRIVYLGAQNINVAAEMFFFGTISAIYLGIGKKNDYLYFLLGLIPLFGIYMTFCRTVYFIAIVFTLLLTILFVIKSPNKKVLIIAIVSALFIGIIICVYYIKAIIELLEPILIKFTDNGRVKVLWPWCWEKFKQYPLFGYGFVAEEHIPNTFAKYYVLLAHNTLLQWLTSLGIIGSLILLGFYFEKYRLLFRKMTLKKFIYVCITLSLALAGIFDQAPSMDFFMFLMPFLVIASFEKDEWKN